LRAGRKLPEQLDFRQWRLQLHGAYRALEPKQHWWHLPDGRTLRVVTTPNPEGGITYVFDDVTERIPLDPRAQAESACIRLCLPVSRADEVAAAGPAADAGMPRRLAAIWWDV
jgi:hypothetical protein